MHTTHDARYTTERDGSLLIEALVGLTLVSVGLLCILILVTQSMKANENVVDRFIGSHLAGEGIEIAE